MPQEKRTTPDKLDLLQGTLDLLVLQTLASMGSQHGYGLARRIEQLSGDEVLLNQGTIYASLVRLQQRRWITAEWGVSETNRRAKYGLLDYQSRDARAGRRDVVLGAPHRGCRPCARAIGREGEVTGRLREIWARLAGFMRGRQPDRALDEELAAHAELAADDYMRRGMSQDEALRLASMKLGSRLAARERAGDQRSMPRMESWIADVRYAVRMMRKSPGFTATSVAMLAAGIGLNVIVLTVTNTVLFKGFPGVRDNHRLLYITARRSGGASYPDYEDWRAQARSFQGMALVHGVQQTYSDANGFPEMFYATEVTANTFGLVGQKPILGRNFTSADEVPGASPVVMLRYGFWERRYGKDSSIVGRVVRLNGVPTTVIGVMPPGFSFPQNQDLWVPLVPTPEVRRRDNHNNWFVLGRLADHATIDDARAEMETIGKRLELAYPLTNKGFPVEALRFHEFFIGPNATLIYQAMVGAVGFVLLIACANLANLLSLAR